MKMQVGDILKSWTIRDYAIGMKIFLSYQLIHHCVCIYQIGDIFIRNITCILYVFLWNNDIVNWSFRKRMLDYDCLVRFQDHRRKG